MPDKIQSRRYKRGLKFCVGDTADKRKENPVSMLQDRGHIYKYYAVQLLELNTKEENAMNTDSISIKIKQADNRLDIIVFLIVGRQ